MNDAVSTAHRKILARVMAHPRPHNLQWRDVWSLLHALPDVQAVEDDRGDLRVDRNGKTVLLHRPRTKDFSDETELQQLCHFLRQSRASLPAATEDGVHVVVVIDHREARVFQAEVHGSEPQHIVPDDLNGTGRSLHYNQDDSSGQRKPESRPFYEEVAKTLAHAGQIVLMGGGTGASSAMEHLMQYLTDHHPAVAERVIETVVVDEHHLTDDQLLAKARGIFALVESVGDAATT